MTAEAQKLYNPNNNLTGRDGGPYLDMEEARLAEEQRAAVENRKPSDNFVASAGIPLVTGAQLLPVASVNNLPSQNQRYGLGVADSVALVAEREKEGGLKSVSEIPKEFVESKENQAKESDTNFSASTDSTNTGGQESQVRSETKVANKNKTTK